MVLGKRNIALVLLLSGLGLMLASGAIAFFWIGGDCHPPAKKRVVLKKVVKKRVVTKPISEPFERTLLTEQGDRIAPSEISPNRKVAVVVMKGTWCPVCVDEVERLSKRAHEVWGAEGFIAAVTDHEPEMNAAFADKSATPFPVLSDHDYDQLKEWGLYRDGMKHPVPGIVFLDEEGKVVKVHRGRYPGKKQDDMIIRTLRSY